MNHLKAYHIGFKRGRETNTLYTWIGDEEYEDSFKRGNLDGINYEVEL